MIFFTSDLHFGHQNIIRICKRPFRDVQDMNESLIEKYNSIVSEEDTVYLIGDVAHKIGLPEAWKLLSSLHGHKVLLLGNHDMQYDYELHNKQQLVFEDICDYKEIQKNGITFCLMHYPMLSWRDSSKGNVMLHGHIHSGLSYNAKNVNDGLRRFDVGVDANHYMPVSIERILEVVKAMHMPDDSNDLKYYLDPETVRANFY